MSSESPGLDAQVLLAHILNKPRAWVLAHPESFLSPAQESSFQRALARLESGEPLPYILGHWEFFGLDFVINPAVLIPRPETEQLVEHALKWLASHPQKRHAIDIGTGSGCIAVALASQVADLHLLAVDISLSALQVARENISRHQLAQRIVLAQTDLIMGIHPTRNRRFDLVTANLPYIPETTLASLHPLRYEPRIALAGGAAGTDLIERLVRDIHLLIAPDGLLLLEIEATIGAAVQQLIQAFLPGAVVQVLSDLAGHNRLVVVQT
jgi:release factor glutamine methyltransferase